MGEPVRSADVAARLRAWAEALNRLPDCTPPELAAALGEPAAQDPVFHGWAFATAPPGTTAVRIDERAGSVFYVEVDLEPCLVTRADLDSALGTGRKGTAMLHDVYPYVYSVELLGELYTCTVFASMAAPAEPAAPARRVLLRRDRTGRTYPGFHTVDDRPVRLERLPTGAVAAYALDLRSGAFGRDDTVLSRIAGRPPGAAEITQGLFDRLVTMLRRAASQSRQVTPMDWTSTTDPAHPYTAELHGVTYLDRINDFPAEAYYTLVVDGQDVDHLDTWPGAWNRG